MGIKSIDVKGVLKEFHECAGAGVLGLHCERQCYTRFFDGNSKNIPTQHDQYFKLTLLVPFTIKVPTNPLYCILLNLKMCLCADEVLLLSVWTNLNCWHQFK